MGAGQGEATQHRCLLHGSFKYRTTWASGGLRSNQSLANGGTASILGLSSNPKPCPTARDGPCGRAAKFHCAPGQKQVCSDSSVWMWVTSLRFPTRWESIPGSLEPIQLQCAQLSDAVPCLRRPYLTVYPARQPCTRTHSLYSC